MRIRLVKCRTGVAAADDGFPAGQRQPAFGHSARMALQTILLKNPENLTFDIRIELIRAGLLLVRKAVLQGAEQSNQYKDPGRGSPSTV